MHAELTTTQTTASCCVPSGIEPLSLEHAQRVAKVFKALGDPTRVRLIALISASEGGEACICDLTDPVGLTQPTVSHHMKQLVDCGLVTREQRGKWAYFRVVPSAADDVAAALETIALPAGTQHR